MMHHNRAMVVAMAATLVYHIKIKVVEVELAFVAA